MTDKPASHSGFRQPDAMQLAAAIVATVREPLLILDRGLVVRQASSAYFQHFKTTPEKTIGLGICQLHGGAWDTPALRGNLQDLVQTNQSFVDFELQQSFGSLGRRTLMVNARSIPDQPLLLLAIEDVTRRSENLRKRQPRKELLGLFIEHAPSALAMFDREMRYLYVSRRWRTDYGLENRRLLGVSHYEIFPEIPDAWREAHRRGLAGETLSAEADPFEHLDGSVQWNRWELHPWLEVDGRVGGIIIFTEDVTKWKKAQEALQISEARYRELAENANSAILRCRADGILTFFNEYAQKLFDYRPEEALGRHASFLLPQATKSEEDLTGLINKIIEHPEQFTHHINQNVCRDGRLIWMSWSNHLEYDDAGRVVEILSVGTDISDLKQAEEELRKSEQRFRQLADAMPQLVWTADTAGRINYCNQRATEFRGLGRQEDGSWQWRPVLHPKDENRTVTAWRKALREGWTYQVEHRAQCIDGTYRWFLSRAKPVSDEQGKISKWFGTTTDIEYLKQTERELKAARRQAEAATRAKSEFLANMSHEIRTPMTIFLGALEHLHEIDKNPEHRTLLEMAEKSARSLRGLINDILDFSQIEAGRVEVHDTPFALHTWLADVVDMFTQPAREKSLHLTTAMAEDVPAIISGDPVRLGQVLTNLVSNAVKFTDQGQILVSVQVRDQLLEVAVADTGIGIAEEKHHLLFDSFSQVDTSFHRRHGGSGLGLAISRNLVELMGGQLTLQSRAGEGSTFTFTLPLKTIRQADPTHPDKAQPATAGAFETVGRILLAEDDPMIREVILMGLAKHHWHVETAANGAEAVEKWQQSDFNVILMDLQMPAMDGLEATRRIRSLERKQGQRTCIIGFTAHARQQTVDACFEAGMDDILTKPVQIKALHSAIDRCLSE